MFQAKPPTSINIYPQVRAGTRFVRFQTPKRVSDFFFFFSGGGPGDQLCWVRPLAACFGRVLDSNLGNQAYDSRTPSFWAFLLSKKGIKNCIQGKTTISQAQLSACFLFLTPPINKQTQIVMFGNFRLVSSIFN